MHQGDISYVEGIIMHPGEAQTTMCPLPYQRDLFEEAYSTIEFVAVKYFAEYHTR
jgi:hypothetical protein